MKHFVIGMETELGISGTRRGTQLSPERIFSQLSNGLRRQIACLNDMGGRGVYTAQGSRFYLDCGGHPEWSSPELSSPAQAVAWDKAMERLLQEAMRRLQLESRGLQLSLVKYNLCPVAPDQVTYGCHEAYTAWVTLDRLGDVADQLLPHLTTRIVYAGAGCLSTHPAGTGYELSQRARHLVRETGAETTCQRAIFSTRVKPADLSSQGWIRVHLIAKDSHRLGLGTYLTLGSTALLILLINEGHRVGAGLRLADPVRSLRLLSLDPSLRVRLPLADGRTLTALEIQEAFLAECDRLLAGADVPDWAHVVARVWRETIETLAADPGKLAGKLDIYRKQRVHQHLLDRAGVSWSQARDAGHLLAELRRRYPAAVLQAVLNDDPHPLPAAAMPAFHEARLLAEGNGRLEQVRLVVRMQMFELNYHELGGVADQAMGTRGIDDSLPAGVVTAADVERAMREPPQGGRAAARGRFIAAHGAEPGWGCNWSHLVNVEKGTTYDLGDPFEAREPAASAASLHEAVRARWTLTGLLGELPW